MLLFLQTNTQVFNLEPATLHKTTTISKRLGVTPLGLPCETQRGIIHTSLLEVQRRMCLESQRDLSGHWLFLVPGCRFCWGGSLGLKQLWIFGSQVIAAHGRKNKYVRTIILMYYHIFSGIPTAMKETCLDLAMWTLPQEPALAMTQLRGMRMILQPRQLSMLGGIRNAQTCATTATTLYWCFRKSCLLAAWWIFLQIQCWLLAFFAEFQVVVFTIPRAIGQSKPHQTSDLLIIVVLSSWHHGLGMQRPDETWLAVDSDPMVNYGYWTCILNGKP